MDLRTNTLSEPLQSVHRDGPRHGYTGDFWRRSKWFIIDSRRSLRGAFRRCLRTEAESAARLIFDDEGLEAVGWCDLTHAQRLVARQLPKLTLTRCRELGVEVHPDQEKRRMKQEERRARARVAPKSLYPLPGEFLSKAGGAR